jgi:hypothetical protein
MIVQTSNYSSTHVSMEVIDDYNCSLVRCYFTQQQLDHFIRTLPRHRANLAATNYQRHDSGETADMI